MNQDGPIRILHVVQRMEAGGLQSFIMNIYRNIDRDKIQFDFLTHYSNEDFYDKEILTLGGRIYRMTVREDKNFLKYFMDLRHFFSEHPEYIIVHGHMDSLGYFYLSAAKKAGVPVRIAHAHIILKGGNLIKRLRGLFNRLYKVNATILLACSEEAGRYMFGSSKFKVIHNPIDVKEFSYDECIRQKIRKELNIENSLVIGHVGRFSAQKNHKFLLNVFREILYKEPNAILLLIGNGELFNEIKQYGETIGVAQNILYMGAREDVCDLYQAMDAFVFPSKYEGFGIVAIEAQAAGLPTICSNEVPKSAKVTSLFSQMSLKESSKTWADKILKEINKNTRHDHSYELIEKGFDVSDVSHYMMDMYKNLYRNFSYNKK